MILGRFILKCDAARGAVPHIFIYTKDKKMEAKFFSEIEKNMDVKTLKDFEKEVRGKINDELEILRDKNDYLSRVLMVGECEMWKKIRDEDYSWLKLKSGQKKRLFRLIDIYRNFDDIIDNVKDLGENVEKIKELQKQ